MVENFFILCSIIFISEDLNFEYLGNSKKKNVRLCAFDELKTVTISIKFLEMVGIHKISRELKILFHEKFTVGIFFRGKKNLLFKIFYCYVHNKRFESPSIFFLSLSSSVCFSLLSALPCLPQRHVDEHQWRMATWKCQLDAHPTSICQSFCN